jgi:hypothetical protein
VMSRTASRAGYFVLNVLALLSTSRRLYRLPHAWLRRRFIGYTDLNRGSSAFEAGKKSPGFGCVAATEEDVVVSRREKRALGGFEAFTLVGAWRCMYTQSDSCE